MYECVHECNSLCVFKFHRLLCYFSQEVIVADVLMCSMHVELNFMWRARASRPT